jgi:hypothetical protein
MIIHRSFRVRNCYFSMTKLLQKQKIFLQLALGCVKLMRVRDITKIRGLGGGGNYVQPHTFGDAPHPHKLYPS